MFLRRASCFSDAGGTKNSKLSCVYSNSIYIYMLDYFCDIRKSNNQATNTCFSPLAFVSKTASIGVCVCVSLQNDVMLGHSRERRKYV